MAALSENPFDILTLMSSKSQCKQRRSVNKPEPQKQKVNVTQKTNNERIEASSKNESNNGMKESVITLQRIASEDSGTSSTSGSDSETLEEDISGWNLSDETHAGERRVRFDLSKTQIVYIERRIVSKEEKKALRKLAREEYKAKKQARNKGVKKHRK